MPMENHQLDEKILEALRNVEHQLKHQRELFAQIMTALQTLTASVAANTAALALLTRAVDTAIADLGNPGATDAQLLALSSIVDANTATENAQTARLNTATGGILPVAPGTVTATAGTGSVALQWNAVPGATGYNVKKSAVAGGPYTAVNPSPLAGTTLVDPEPAGVPVFYVVSAVNGAGEGPNSLEVTATPL